ncbi:MAG: AmmeMemoRadiSam system protein B [Candidatus Magasanikbacteria bacterium]|nr:AmmeMemoRadiSam system protein B [Candidatus Magasanikbacteria bacterium]USN52041.1 MAG: AmmeMemoRadiSam system protein B [Candidatus Nomurabacteria bacterium]HPF95235.1 AmmeMemoRadiSam system protein B [bacterium]
MIVFAAMVPHSPLLIPSVGKEHRDALAQTLKAYEQIEQALYLAKPDTIIIISPHAQMYPDAFSGNMSPKYIGSLKAFGDFEPLFEAKADFLLLDHIHRAMRDNKVPFTLSSSEELDYGISIPYSLLTTHLPNVKLAPLSTSMLGVAEHAQFGRELANIVRQETHRIAIIASADLSHHANEASPKGATAEGAWFETTVREAALTQNLQSLLEMDSAKCEAAGQCGQKPLAILLGALEGINLKASELSYEAPFGVGYSVIRFDLA